MNLKHVLYSIAVAGATVIPLAGGCALGRKGPIPGSLAASQNGNYVSFERVGVAGMQYELDDGALRLYNGLLVTQNPSASALTGILARADENGDGKISQSELERALQPTKGDMLPQQNHAAHVHPRSAPVTAAKRDASYMPCNRFMLPEGKEQQHQQRQQYTPEDCVLQNAAPEGKPPLTIGGVLLGR